jgi:threonine synthase
MQEFETSGELVIEPKYLRQAKLDFLSSSSTKEEILETMRNLFRNENYLVCPHTATGVLAIDNLKSQLLNTSCVLATAHAAKFEEALTLALKKNEIPKKPTVLENLFLLTKRFTKLENDLESIKKFVFSKSSIKKVRRANSSAYDEDSVLNVKNKNLDAIVLFSMVFVATVFVVVRNLIYK